MPEYKHELRKNKNTKNAEEKTKVRVEKLKMKLQLNTRRIAHMLRQRRNAR